MRQPGADGILEDLRKDHELQIAAVSAGALRRR
jgi:hypothetical protein